MDFVAAVATEVAWYGWGWIAFIALAYIPARYLGWPGIIGSGLVMLFLLIPIDLAWIFDDMRRHPENGRDADFVFWLGVLLRAFLFLSLTLKCNNCNR